MYFVAEKREPQGLNSSLIVRITTLGYAWSYANFNNHNLFAANTVSLSAEIYRSVDENGNVVFEDTPSPNSELINVDELQTIKPPLAGKFQYTPKVK